MAEVDILRPAEPDRLAIVGLGIDLPGCPDLPSFARWIERSGPAPADRTGWTAAGSLARASASALADLIQPGWQAGEAGWLAIGPAGEISTLRALPQVGGQFVDFSGYSEPLPAMLHQAYEWLETRETRLVFLAGCAPGAEIHDLNPTLGFDRSIRGFKPGAGAVVVGLTRLEEARRLGARVYALIESLASLEGQSGAPEPAVLQACAAAALRAAGLEPRQVGYLEALACGEDVLDGVEIQGLTSVYRGSDMETALGSVQTQTGYLAGVNGLAGLARAAIAISRRLRPGASGWSGPKYADAWSGSTLYVPIETLTWFASGKRAAGVSILGKNGICGHLLLSGESASIETGSNIRDAGIYLFLFGANSEADLAAQFETFQKDLKSGAGLAELAARTYKRSQASSNKWLAAILGHTPEETLREVDFALRGVPAALEKGSEWQTPLGSYFSPAPLGPASQVAFVYPGAFNSYLGMGRSLFLLFPGLYTRLEEITRDPGAALGEKKLYPRSPAALSKEQIEACEAALLNDPFTMMTSGATLSVALTAILRNIFEVKPASAFGYSLGENSMLFSMGVWADGLHAIQGLFDSPLFHHRLAGPQNAVREHWGLAPLPENDPGGNLWENYLLMVPAERVKEALDGEDRVYLTHINTPRQVVIGGDPQGCRRVIDRLKCSSLKAPFDYVLHCQAMESEYPALYQVHNLAVHSAPDVRLYSAAEDRPFEISQSGITGSIARDLCSMLDFPRLVETVYADGARIFIELGAGSNCSKWIEDTLRGRPFLSISANRKGVDDATSLLRVLARLVSHQVKVNLEPLYHL